MDDEFIEVTFIDGDATTLPPEYRDDQPLNEFYEGMVEWIKLSGCTCTPRVLIAKPHDELVAIKLVHRDSCMGLQRSRMGMN